jgi:hypothetical protein
MMEEYALSLVLTEWDREQEWEEVWRDGNEATVICESFEDWDIGSLESFASDLVEKLRDAYSLALQYEGGDKR